MTLAEKVKRLQEASNEVAFGYNDSGCFWSMQYGERGCGSMLEGFGERIHALDADDFEEAVDYFLQERGLVERRDQGQRADSYKHLGGPHVGGA